MFVCNVRNLQSSLTGVQRYTTEILSRLSIEFEVACPQQTASGLIGHAWEQAMLPLRLKDRLLWSPSNSGPLAIDKQVVTIHDLAPLDHPEWSSARFAAWYKFLVPRLINRVRHVITDSEFSRQRILHYCPGAASKIEVIPLAADRRFKPATAAEIDKMTAQLNLPSRHYFMALGSLEPRKNLTRLLAAWRNLYSELPEEVWLVLAGAKGKSLIFNDDPYGQLPPRVFLTGHVPDKFLPALYSGSIASIYLSCYEGFGLPPLEAMSCGTPVMVSNKASIPEVVGDAALFTDPYNEDEIAQAFLTLLGNTTLRRELVVRGLERAKTFSWELTAEKTQQLLEAASRK